MFDLGSFQTNLNPRTYLGAPRFKLARYMGCTYGGAHDHGCSAAACADSDGVWWVVMAFPCAAHQREFERLTGSNG